MEENKNEEKNNNESKIKKNEIFESEIQIKTIVELENHIIDDNKRLELSGHQQLLVVSSGTDINKTQTVRTDNQTLGGQQYLAKSAPDLNNNTNKNNDFIAVNK